MGLILLGKNKLLLRKHRNDTQSSLLLIIITIVLLTAATGANAETLADEAPDAEQQQDQTTKNKPTSKNKNTQAVILSVNITGVDPAMEKSLLAALAINRATDEAKLSVSRVRNLHDRATTQLLNTLEALGFYHAKVQAELTNQSTAWHATYAVTLGRPTRIDKITLDVIGAGRNHAELKKQLLLPKLQLNSVITHQNYEQSKEALLTTAQNFGFLNVKFASSKIKINRDNYHAEIELTLDTGRQYTFGNVSFHDTKYSNDLLNRFVPFNFNENYTANKLNLFHKNLADSDLFNKIRIDPEPILDHKPNNQEIHPPALNSQVPVSVRLVDKPLDHFTGSVGYGTDTSFRASLGWQHRRVEPSGHKFNTGISVSGIKKQIFGSYSIPGHHAANDKYVVSSSISEGTSQQKFSKKEEVSLAKIKKINDLQTYWTIQYFTEHFKVVPDHTMQHKKYLLPSVKSSWVETPEDTELLFGKKLDLIALGGLDMLLSSTNLLQGQATGKWVTKLASNTRLLTRANLGYTSAKKFNNVPFSLRFFTGGDNTVRGFGYRSLGPQDVDAEGNLIVVGGKNLVEASIEVDQRIYRELLGAVFIDAGNAMNDFNLNLPAGAGVGLRWATKVGMLRIDFAKQIHKIQSKNIRIHLTFGKDL